jgi:mRNA interferase RelE/StbE
LTANYKIFETAQFVEDKETSLANQKERVALKLLHYAYPQLRGNPHFGKNIKKLINYHPETWRYRIGDHRFFYSIDEKRKYVIMLTIDLRKDAY